MENQEQPKLERETQGIHTRQYNLYNYLVRKGDQEWTSELEIAKNLDYGYDYDHSDLKLFHDSQARHRITEDIRALNKSDIIHKLIISDSRGVKIANKQEIEKWLDRERARCLAKLSRLGKMARKVMNDQQYRITLTKYEKDIYETFLKEKEAKDELRR